MFRFLTERWLLERKQRPIRGQEEQRKGERPLLGMGSQLWWGRWWQLWWGRRRQLWRGWRWWGRLIKTIHYPATKRDDKHRKKWKLLTCIRNWFKFAALILDPDVRFCSRYQCISVIVCMIMLLVCVSCNVYVDSYSDDLVLEIEINSIKCKT